MAGRNAPTLLIVGTLVASLMSTNAFMGETGVGLFRFSRGGHHPHGDQLHRLHGRRSVFRPLSCAAAVPSPWPSTFGQRFDSRRVQVAAGVTIVLGCTAYLVMVTQGAATIINEVTGLPFYGTLFIAWAGYTLFTLYSGSSGVVLTDTMMFLLFASSSVPGAGLYRR